ncbi:RteC domain-containing protein [Mesonia sp. MT50]|uniref:RteC domain-containing protein n=1 Tax=Mesonia profundi TaxID=3070998 RepID=A0ABU1A5V7_9FLAO|nr:RteC domain-containing protein [Mesonia profundi]MDQ7918266.1 RteC domain-containing protein [Mesonia profundi]
MEAYKKLLSKLEEEFDHLETEIDDALMRAEKGMGLGKQYINQMRGLVIDRDFNNEQEECFFFKSIKPQAVSKLIYYIKLFSIESKRPRSSKKAKKRYLQLEIDKLQNYFNENLEFYHYYRRGSVNLDHHFFLRRKANFRLHPDSIHFVTDAQFSTSHDSSVATIIAYDMLIVYLQKEIEHILYQQNVVPLKVKKSIPTAKWSHNKVDLIELIYALHTTGAINGGAASINEIALLFERVFSIELGDYYRTFLELRSRKINQLKFLDLLKSSLYQRMLAADE